MPAPDPLDELRERIRATEEAAGRLADKARASIPPQGWASSEEREHTAAELQALVGLLTALRDVVPPEIWDQLREIIRQLLLLVRALIDWWVERMEPGQRVPGRRAEPEDIPIS